MSDWILGPGVAQAIEEAGDEARSDEIFVILDEGHKVSQTFGRDAIYYWIQEDNRTRRTPLFEVPEEPVEPIVYWDPYLHMAGQVYSWTCASCSLDWVMRSTGLAPDYNRERAVYEIGYPENINENVGLTNATGPGQALRDVYAQYNQPTSQAWLGFDDVYEIAQDSTGQMSGSNWYHWVALRGIQGDNIWVANSAPGYKGIWDTLSRADFNRLGPFNVVWLE